MLCKNETCGYSKPYLGNKLFVLSYHDDPITRPNALDIKVTRTTKYKCPNGHITEDKNVISINPELQRPIRGNSTLKSRKHNKLQRRRKALARHR